MSSRMPLPAAGSGRESDLGEHGDVVALVRRTRVLRALAVIAAAPQPGNGAGCGIREHARLADDARRVRGRDGHLNHVDAVERGVWILLRVEVRAAGELVARSDRARARHVDVDVPLVVGIDDERVRVRPAAGLHRRHLFRPADVADVEDADAAEALAAHRSLHALRAAIDPPARLLHRHDQEMAVDRHVALTAGAHHRRDQPGLVGSLDIVGVEPMIVADEDHVAAEGEIRVGEAGSIRQRRDRTEAAHRAEAGSARSHWRSCRADPRRWRRSASWERVPRHRRPRWRLRIEEAFRLRQARNHLHVARRFTGVVETGLETDARIGRGRRPLLREAGRQRDQHNYRRTRQLGHTWQYTRREVIVAAP